MKAIRVAFTDFWDGFQCCDNYFLDTLRKFYIVEIVNNLEEAEYLFYSCFGHEHMKYNGVKIFYTGENLVPDFNQCDYAIGFEHMQYDDRYIRLPLYVVNYRNDYRHMMQIRGNIKLRDKFCSMVVSNGGLADNVRKDIFEKLSEYKKVDSGGRYLNNIGQPNGVIDKQVFLEQYKFSLAIENSSHPGYCTEKIVQAFAAGTIPIYWGDPKIGTYFNEKAFINCNRFESLDDMLKYVISIDMDNNKFQAMLNEPIINENEGIDAYDKKFENWLCHIINQPLNKASRRSFYGREAVYNKQYIRRIDYEQKYSEFEKKSMIGKIASILDRR